MEEDTITVQKRILGSFEFDVFADLRRGQEIYTVRLWEEGKQVASASGPDLAQVYREIDQTADALVSAYCA